LTETGCTIVPQAGLTNLNGVATEETKVASMLGKFKCVIWIRLFNGYEI
jgi:hypothetical protein